MGRVGWSLAVVAGMALLVAVLFGSQEAIGIPMPLILAAAGGVALFVRSRPARTIELGWSGGTAVIVPVGDIPLRPATVPRSGKGSVTWSLARVEGRELLGSPWFAAGVGFWIVLLGTMGYLFVEDINRSWWEFFALAPMMAHPFAGMAIVAAHRNRSRSGRDGCDELFDSCPADADARTLGHLATAWIGAVTCMVGVAVFIVLVLARNERSYGPIDGEALAAMLTCGAVGAGAVALGTTLGRWARFVLVPFAAVVGIGFASGQLNGMGGKGWAPGRFLGTFTASSGIDTIFYTRPAWGRLLWLVALGVIVGAAGLVGARVARRAQLVTALAAAVAIVAAVLVVRPAPDGDVDTIASRIIDPMAHQTCRQVVPDVKACAYKEYAELGDRTADAVRPVAAAVPLGVLDDVVFLQHFDNDTRQLQADVAAAIDGRVPRLPSHALRIRFFSHPKNFDAARLRMAAYAVGLPTETGEDRIGRVVAGEARGVIVLWLASRGLTGKHLGRFVNEAEVHEPEDNDATYRGAIWPATCEGEDGVLSWAPKDLAAARQLARLPADHVQRVIHDDWARWVQAEATTDSLLIAAGLAPLGAPERVEARELYMLTQPAIVAFPRTFHAIALPSVAALAVAAGSPTAITLARGGQDLVLAWVAAAVIGAAAAAFAVDDDASVLLAPSPTALMTRRASRLAAAACPLLAAWAAVAGLTAVGGRFHNVPLAMLGVTAWAVSGFAVAVASRSTGIGGFASGLTVPLFVTAMSVQYDWMPRIADPASNGRWLWIGVLAWALALWLARDPARRRV